MKDGQPCDIPQRTECLLNSFQVQLPQAVSVDTLEALACLDHVSLRASAARLGKMLRFLKLPLLDHHRVRRHRRPRA